MTLAVGHRFLYPDWGKLGILHILTGHGTMSQSDQGGPQRKRRTREHIVEDLSENFLERKVLENGHVLRRPERDYGVDVTMFHFDEGGALENGEVRFQLKATDHLNMIHQDTVVSFAIKTGDLHVWAGEIYPFILVVFDAQNEEAYWLHIQEYAQLHQEYKESDQKTVNVHIPATNKLTAETIKEFRNKSLQFVHPTKDTLLVFSMRDNPDVDRLVRPADITSVEFRLQHAGLLSGSLDHAALQQSGR